MTQDASAPNAPLDPVAVFEDYRDRIHRYALGLVRDPADADDLVRPNLVDGLSDAFRAGILLKDFQRLTNPEIAEMLECSVATVKIRLHRARLKLKAAAKLNITSGGRCGGPQVIGRLVYSPLVSCMRTSLTPVP